MVRHYRELIAYGAGWTDPERQQPVGDTGRHEPRQLDAIVDAELERALADPDPLRGIAQLTARWAAALPLAACHAARAGRIQLAAADARATVQPISGESPVCTPLLRGRRVTQCE